MTARRPTRQMVAPVAEVSDACRQQLLTGHDCFGDGYMDDTERMREDWRRFRVELLAGWIALRPGTRPFGWWRFDAPARRETIDGSDHPFDRLERQERCAVWHAQHPAMRHPERFYELFFGVPCIVVGEGHVHYETERQHLARLNLLTVEEQQTKETK